ncbi:hypothetical protein N0M98_06255 [Paenibacillus doosanensis]|uniref:Uncharacterized protein n=1 Tax=Paenibacillus konkukensis TaxID=2020716 RepID=A0ABY4RIL2_9BACL|nr:MULTISPECIES: hypothetical protein [Paenibacillus]MCS7459739.1 hypothetical protein [Paenibacillus doosanensis]UQZ81845.1 hypothetical protein SK3146_01001 [Paenibacillus konkukensis]
MTKQYAIDMAKKLFRETNKSYYVIFEPDSNEYSIIDQDEFTKNAGEWNNLVIFSIEG